MFILIQYITITTITIYPYVSGNPKKQKKKLKKSNNERSFIYVYDIYVCICFLEFQPNFYAFNFAIINNLKPSYISVATNSPKLFTSLMTILSDNSKDNLFPNQRGHWLFSCYGDNHSNKTITLKFKPYPQNIPANPKHWKTKSGLPFS